MSLIFADSFDHYEIGGVGGNVWVVKGKWENGVLDRATGRRGTGGCGVETVNLFNRPLKNLGAHKTLIVGFAAFVTASSGSPIVGPTDEGKFGFQFDNDSIQYIRLGMSTDGKLRISRGTYPQVSEGPTNIIGFPAATPLWTSAPNVVPFAQWCFIELKVTFDYSVGAFELRLNGETLVSQTNVRTVPFLWYDDPNDPQFLNPAEATQIRFNGTGIIDDLYVLNDSGSRNNDFLGDLQVDYLAPDGTGLRSESVIVGTAPATTRWESNVISDDGVTAVQFDASGDSDSYTFQDLPYDTATIYGVQVTAQARKSDGGTARLTMTNDVNSETVDALPVKQTPSAGDNYAMLHATLDESADGPWTLELVNDSEFGTRRETL